MHRRTTAVASALAILAAGCGLMTTGEPPAHTTGAVPAAPDPGAVPVTPGDDLANPKLPGYRLAWHDEFDGAAIDETSWDIWQGGMRDSVLARDSVSVRDGVAKFTTYTDSAGVHHTGLIRTRTQWSYGYFEARVRLHDAPGEWCAFFLFPDTYGSFPGDPATAGVEIDIFEHRFIDDSGWNIADMVQVGLNWNGVGGKWEKSNATLGLPDGGKIQGAWHTFAALWTPSGYAFYADDVPLWTPTGPPTARAAPVFLDCEILVNSWAGPAPPGGYGTLETSTTGMEVDWVRFWQPQ